MQRMHEHHSAEDEAWNQSQADRYLGCVPNPRRRKQEHDKCGSVDGEGKGPSHSQSLESVERGGKLRDAHHDQ